MFMISNIIPWFIERQFYKIELYLLLKIIIKIIIIKFDIKTIGSLVYYFGESKMWKSRRKEKWEREKKEWIARAMPSSHTARKESLHLNYSKGIKGDHRKSLEEVTRVAIIW